MRLVAHAACFAFALLCDASGVLELPVLGGRPVLFAALAACVALRGSALSGGAWGFGSGLALGLLFADSRIGARALGGLLAGSVPVAFRRLLFWHRATGQAAMGVVAGLCYGLAGLLAGLARGDLAGAPFAQVPHLVVDALLTGAACPLLFRLLARVDRQV